MVVPQAKTTYMHAFHARSNKISFLHSNGLLVKLVCVLMPTLKSHSKVDFRIVRPRLACYLAARKSHVTKWISPSSSLLSMYLSFFEMTMESSDFLNCCCLRRNSQSAVYHTVYHTGCKLAHVYPSICTMKNIVDALKYSLHTISIYTGGDPPPGFRAYQKKYTQPPQSFESH